jgi:hypothetical protein
VVAFAVMISTPIMFPVTIITAVAIMIAAIIVITEVPASVAVPAVIMFNPAVFSLPVTAIELPPIVMRQHPASPRVRRPSPITFMPAIMPSDRIPVTLDPQELGSGGRRQNSNHAGRRRRPDGDPDRDLSADYRQGKQ